KYLREVLNLDEIDPDAFIRRATPVFLSKQEDEWIAALYGFLSGQRAWLRNLASRRDHGWAFYEVPFFDKCIIRLQDGTHIKPFADEHGKVPAAYLPIAGSSLPSVRVSIAAKKEANDFLTTIGFRQPDLSDQVIDTLLPKYRKALDRLPESY